MQQAHQNRGEVDPMAYGVIAHLSAGGEIVPAQLDAGMTWSPERMLAAAVLVDALLYVREHYNKVGYEPEVTRDLAWIQSEDTGWPYSFVPLCHHLGLEPDFVRMVVRGWLADPAKRREPIQSGQRRGSRKKTNARVLMIGRTTKTAVAGSGRRRARAA